jgi:hypothetical protein
VTGEDNIARFDSRQYRKVKTSEWLTWRQETGGQEVEIGLQGKCGSREARVGEQEVTRPKLADWEILKQKGERFM